MDKIEQALARLFQTQRIVFWYDVKKELRTEYEALTLPDVEKIELKNNQFGLKHRILREEPKQKFLLYYEGPQPADLNNWLLDVQLAHADFKADQVSLWLSEVGLPPEFWDVVQDHAEFYKAASRRKALKERLGRDDSAAAIRLKMVAICVNPSTEARLDAILETLLDELAAAGDDSLRLIQRAGLDSFLWQQLQRHFGYTSDSPGLHDFVIELFKAAYALGLQKPAPLNPEAVVFLNRWKDSRRHHVAFEKLSDEVAAMLNIENDLPQQEGRNLIGLDYFRLIDQKILTDLVQQVVNRTLSASEVSSLIRRRRTSHWFNHFSHIYDAIDHANQFVAALEQADLTIQSLADGVRKYSESWYQLDQHYRQFITHSRAARQAVSLLEPLAERVENLYNNNFLLKVNDTWQQVVDTAGQWAAPSVIPQQEFFERFVRPFLADNKKVTVIISDALRYEIGAELLERIEREDRYTASLEPMLTMLPSYTQLGMAALLPHSSLALKNKTIWIDSQSSVGTENRSKILAQSVPGDATAIQADSLLAMTRNESRALFRDHQVIYVYHNRIDATGDKRDTEEQVFEAVETGLAELIEIIKKLTSANATNMLLTADHGFIYQHRPLDESDFSSIEVSGDDIQQRNRRFVIGTGLQANQSVKLFSPADIGFQSDGEIEILIPKSINRLRQQGTGSRYVHGGAALQEVIVPLLRINKKRQSDIGQVTVDILGGTSSTISTGQHAVIFYQTEPVSAKLQGRILRAGIYTHSGDLISDRHDLIFDFTTENPREREISIRFVLSRKAEQANEQEVFLKLEEQVADTSHYREYKSRRYLLRRSFTTDFDF